MKKKLISLMLIGTMVVSITACSNGNAGSSTGESESIVGETETDSQEVGQDIDLNAYNEKSEEVYKNTLSEFEEAYAASDDAETISERYALMAIAEAKLLETGVMIPLNTIGGYYALSKVAPYSIDYTLWGNDMYRFHQALVTTELIKADDRAAMKEKWSELKGTGTFAEWEKSYLQEHGYTLKDSYNYVYNGDPVTWDVLATSLAADSEAIINTYDGLMEYDVEGELQPALAESYEVSEDGLTYTFHIRQGQQWVDSQGRKVADVVADDFVAGMQHMMDAQGGLEYLVEGIIKNASGYISGEITDFDEVGVKVVDDYTVEYTLESPCTYFMTMLGYGVFAPMSRTYYESMGGQFGAAYDSGAADYKYGQDTNSIAYCGPYVVTNATAKNTIVFKANESYWNADNINLKTITWLYNDGSDATKTYNDLMANVLDNASLNVSTIAVAKEDGYFDDYAYISSTDATSYMAYFNLNREAFANVNDPTTVVSTETEEEKARTNAALNNVHFRRAIAYALDRGAYEAQTKGEELKYTSLRNSYTPGTFVSLEEETTVDINGTPTTFAEGTYYGEIMQAQVDADGVKIKVFDKDADDGKGSSDGYDGWYNPDNAVEEFNLAVKELADQGIVIDENNYICIELPYPSNDERYTNKANAFKSSVETVLGKAVEIRLDECRDLNEWYYAGYYTSYGYENNFDIYDLSGWGPDYGDPSTYLDTFLPDYAGYVTKSLGIY